MVPRIRVAPVSASVAVRWERWASVSSLPWTLLWTWLWTTACTAPVDSRHPVTDSVAPVWPAAWQAEEITVVVDDATTLAGTVTVPAPRSGVGEGRRRRPAVLVIGGSGPQDRDGQRPELPGYAPWRELSDGLAAAGYVVLRVDDRGTAASRGRFAGATTDDFARDAAACVAWLRAHPAVDPARVVLVGHSEGAVVALLVARDDPVINALVLLGAPARTGREIARWQREQLVLRDGARFPPHARAAVLAAADVEAESLAQHDPWLRRWFVLDPRAVAAGVRQPVLLVHGATDQQVPSSHAAELAAVLRRAGARHVAVHLLRDTDHLLLPDADGDPDGYVRLSDRHLRTDVLAVTTQFLSIHTASR